MVATGPGSRKYEARACAIGFQCSRVVPKYAPFELDAVLESGADLGQAGAQALHDGVALGDRIVARGGAGRGG